MYLDIRAFQTPTKNAHIPKLLGERGDAYGYFGRPGAGALRLQLFLFAGNLFSSGGSGRMKCRSRRIERGACCCGGMGASSTTSCLTMPLTSLLDWDQGVELGGM